MSLVNCPSCRTPLEIPPELTGQAVGCPRCGMQFSLPRGTAVPPGVTAPTQSQNASLPFVEDDAPSTNYSRSSWKSAPEHSGSLLDLFDITFKRYVTPLIVKITWVLTLAVAALWLVATVIVLLLGSLPIPGLGTESADSITQRPSISSDWDTDSFDPSSFQSPRSSPSRRPTSSDSPARSITTDGEDASFAGVVFRLAYLASQVIAVVLMLLWVRVILESIIVIFNIAASLRSIDRKTKSR